METKTLEKTCDIVVVGAGHAGCEASLACARLGLDTVMFTVSVDSIALMPCNPNVGGSSKGHLVKELDALGGRDGKKYRQNFYSVKDAEQFQGTGSSFTESTGRQTGLQHRDEKDSGKSGKFDH